MSTFLITLLLTLSFATGRVSSFVVPRPAARYIRHSSAFVIDKGSINFPACHSICSPAGPRCRANNRKLIVSCGASGSSSEGEVGGTPKEEERTWSPQDLTQNNPGYLPIPENDYIKQYQRHTELWPVEFFIIAYRQTTNPTTGKAETQILVRKSANGTSKYGLGTGVPATRWLLSGTKLPLGYQWSEPRISFDASNFPEFPKDDGRTESWAYDKIDIREDAFHGRDMAPECQDAELEEYAMKTWNELKKSLSDPKKRQNLSMWDSSVHSVVLNIIEKPNCVAAIQGTLRMSGLFQRRDDDEADATNSSGTRYVSLGENAPDPTDLVRSVRIYTMFPQMPDPMPLPSTPPEEQQKEIRNRASRMAESGRDPHHDVHGRVYTHISTSNVSNTIHGVYSTLDVTDRLPGHRDDETPPALDLFGTQQIKREWVSLSDLKVLDSDGESIGIEDTKPTFISGFIVRQLVKDGVIPIQG